MPDSRPSETVEYHPDAYTNSCPNVGDFQYVLARDTTDRLDLIDAEAKAAGLEILVEETKQDGLYRAYIARTYHHPSLPGWKFQRRWRYWSAFLDSHVEPENWYELWKQDGSYSPTTVYHGKLMSTRNAQLLWAIDGGNIRADGHCGSPKPDDPVSGYHIDTPNSLAVLVAALIVNETDDGASNVEAESTSKT